MIERTLGRLHAPDDRDCNFPMSAVLAAEPEPRESRFWWANGLWGNQGSNPHCVEYAWHHLLSDGPVTQRKGELWTPGSEYPNIQALDEWHPNPHDGSSIRAGAKRMQALGYISGYHWAYDLGTLVQALLTTGPVVVGTNWYSTMFHPNSVGLVKVEGRNHGGHAYLLDGISTSKELIRIKNSWGRTWGQRGFALISFKDMERLIQEDGEACIATEVKV